MIKMRKRISVLVVAVLIAAFMSMGIQGCTNFKKNTYSSLFAAGSVYDMSLKAIAMLQKQGVIDEAKRLMINKAADAYRTSYFVAVDSFAAFSITESTELKSVLQNMMDALTQNWQAIQDLINQFAPGTIQGRLSFSINKRVTVDKVADNPKLKAADPKKLNPALVPIIISVIGLVVQYGIPEAMALIDAFKKVEISAEDIAKLKDLVKPAGLY